jgi:Tetratricopeptide repeat
MLRTAVFLLCLQLAARAAAEPPVERLRDLYFGEALYYADQGQYFEALERLDTELAQYYHIDEPGLDTLHYHVDAAEFSVGDFELNYRMHQRAGRAIKAVLEGDVDESVRNEAAFRLARIHFQKGQLEDALQAIDRIDGRVPESIRDEIGYLRANIYLATGRAEEAIGLLRRSQNSEPLAGFAAYNLGIALLDTDRHRDGIAALERAGEAAAHDEAQLAIRDKANLVLGSLLMDEGEFVEAQASFDRVRLEGPLSNRALLRAGWASSSAQDFERAIVPWSLLAQRESTDAAVQEAKLALPFAYAQLDIHGRAALLYGEALESFDGEAKKLEASIDSIRQGDFLEVLVREEIRHDKDWIIRLRELPESPETYYLMELLASHDFQTALQNYLDLEDLRAKLARWQVSFDAFEDMIELRRAYYEPILPEVDQKFRELDSRIRLRREQYGLLQERLQSLLTAPRPYFLATTDERSVVEEIDRIDQALEGDTSAQAQALRERAARLRGVLQYTLWTEYHERLTAFDEHLRALQGAIDTMQAQYDSYVRVRQAAVHGFEGYEVPLRRLRMRVADAQSGVQRLMQRQGHLIERVAVEELLARLQRLNEYRDEARFALADSYDRATAARAKEEAPRTVSADLSTEPGTDQ